jgi:hypothetical protein
MKGRHSWKVREMPSAAIRYGGSPTMLLLWKTMVAPGSAAMKPVSRL